MENVMEFILNLFMGDGLIIAVASFVVGEIVKGLNFIPNKFIPLIGGVLGVILGVAMPGLFADKDLVTAGILGLILGWAATGGYETIRNLKGGN